MAKRSTPTHPAFDPAGCKTKFKAFTVLRKEGTGGLYVMRELQLIQENGVYAVLSQKDTVEDIFDNQLGKIEHAIVVENS